MTLRRSLLAAGGAMMSMLALQVQASPDADMPMPQEQAPVASERTQRVSPASADFVGDDYEYCLVCHGSVGQGNPAIEAPVLAGMESWYLDNQMQAFRNGWRGRHKDDLVGMEMYPVATALQESEIPAVIEYIEALPAQPAVAAVDAQETDAGKTLYGSCSACHGPGARGMPELAAPALAYQDGTYLLRQLKHFRDGVRGSAEGDLRGSRMAAAAQGLSDQAMDDLVSYIKTLVP